jgi:hypothetical protein
MDKIVWHSALSYEDVKHLPYDVKEQLFDDLNNAVATICIELGIPNFDEPTEEKEDGCDHSSVVIANLLGETTCLQCGKENK